MQDAKAFNLGVAPVTYGEVDRPPRGDYAAARADYTCEQDWSTYSEAEHELYRRLHARQSAQLPGLACTEFIQAVSHLGTPERIPRFEDLSERLYRLTRWEVVGGAAILAAVLVDRSRRMVPEPPGD